MTTTCLRRFRPGTLSRRPTASVEPAPGAARSEKVGSSPLWVSRAAARPRSTNMADCILWWLQGSRTSRKVDRNGRGGADRRAPARDVGTLRFREPAGSGNPQVEQLAALIVGELERLSVGAQLVAAVRLHLEERQGVGLDIEEPRPGAQPLGRIDDPARFPTGASCVGAYLAGLLLGGKLD